MLKFIYFSCGLFVLAACTNLLKRNVAQYQSASVLFYESSTCSKTSCSEKKYNLSNENEYQLFQSNLKELIELSKNNKNKTADSLDMDDLTQFDLGNSSITKGCKLAFELLKNENMQESAAQINEIFAAIKNNFRPPLDTQFQLFYLPVEFFSRFKYNQVAALDTAQIPPDPKTNTFWQQNRSHQDLFVGFDRQQKNNFSNISCDYDKPKSGFGIHPGFHVRCGDKKFKVKLGTEVHSAAFNARIYHALGYHVPMIDYIENPVINYNRRLLTEFNSRRIENFRIQLGQSTLYKISNEHYYSPYEFIKEIQLLDGTTMTAKDLKSNLFKNPNLDKPELTPENFNTAFEEKISRITLLPASYIEKTEDIQIGPWRYDQLDHQNHLELKGLQLLAAWVGNFDMRMDNTRLVRSNENGKVVLKHTLADVGSGLGEAGFLPKNQSTQIDKMAWSVTKVFIDHNLQNNIERLEIVGLMNIEVNKAFKNMSFSDGQWMIKKLCEITDNQLKSALISAGLNSAESRLAFEKLLSRRTQMVKDFKLESLLPKCSVETNKQLNYQESQDGRFQAELVNGETVFAKSSSVAVKNGHLINQ